MIANSIVSENIAPSQNNIPEIASHFNKFSHDNKKKNSEKIKQEQTIKEESMKRGFSNALDELFYDMQKGVPITSSHKDKLIENHLTLPGLEKGSKG